MAIHKAMRAALQALSYPANIDVEKTYKVSRALGNLRAPLSPLYHFWDQQIERDGHSVRVRLYRPHKQQRSRVLLFFHGGGWVLENIDTYNAVCRNLVNQTGCLVASVEYGLAPEHTFPEGLEDCYAAPKHSISIRNSWASRRRKSRWLVTRRAAIWRQRFHYWRGTAGNFPLQNKSCSIRQRITITVRLRVLLPSMKMDRTTC